MRHGDISNRGAVILAIDARALVKFRKLTLIKRLFKAKALYLDNQVANHINRLWKSTEYNIVIVNTIDSGIDTHELKELLDSSHTNYSKIETVKSEQELTDLCTNYFIGYFYANDCTQIPPKSYPIQEFFYITT